MNDTTSMVRLMALSDGNINVLMNDVLCSHVVSSSEDIVGLISLAVSK